MNILNVDGLFLAEHFRRAGHDVCTVGKYQACDIRVQGLTFHTDIADLLRERDFEPDLVFWCDQGFLPMVLGLEAFTCPVIGYSIDGYCNPWHVPFSAGFDHVFSAQRDHAALFHIPRVPRPATWMPLFCDPDLDALPALERDIPVSFVGTLEPRNIPQRLPFLKAFKKRHPLFFMQGDFREIFGRSRIVLNQSAVGELNFRVFEAMACGAALLNEDTGFGLDELFTPGEDILPPYPVDDADAAAAIARTALADPDRLACIAARGRDKVLSAHTAAHRMETVVKTAESLRADRAWEQRHKNSDIVRGEVAKAMAFVAADLTDPAFADTRDAYLRLSGNYAARWDRLRAHLPPVTT